MKRTLTALVAAATLAGAAVASSVPAQAYWRGGWGWGLGGFAAGAVIGSALARPYYPYGYYGYYAPRPACGGGCGTAILGFAPAFDQPGRA
jgi:hypothetical protein